MGSNLLLPRYLLLYSSLAKLPLHNCSGKIAKILRETSVLDLFLIKLWAGTNFI